MGDECAANHTRLALHQARRGSHFFVYGHSALDAKQNARGPKLFASRQSRETSEAVARQSLLRDEQVVYARKNSAAIDAGVFHNDVISVGNENVLLYHEQAFVNTPQDIAELKRRNAELIAIKVSVAKVSMAAAVKSYLFNSQLVTLAPDHMALIMPSDCREITEVREFIDALISSKRTPIHEAHYFDLK